MSAMARACGADPAAMTCQDGLDLTHYLAAAQRLHRSNPSHGSYALVEERIW